MPPKGAAKVEKEGKRAPGKRADKDAPLTHAELLRLEAMSVVPGLITDVFDGAIDALQQKRLTGAVTTYTATMLREAILQTLELFHIGADPGETDLLDSTWTADEEPPHPSNDTWSRDMLSLLRLETKVGGTRGAPRHMAASAKLGTPAPRDARASTDSTSTATHGSFNWAAHAKAFDAPAPPRAREDTARAKVNIHKVDEDAMRVPPRSDTDAERNLVPSTRLGRQLAREQHEEVRRVHATQEHFGARDYLYDGENSTVVATPVSRPEMLPKMAAPTAAHVRDTLASAASGANVAGARRMSGAARPSTSGGGLRARGRSRASTPGLLGADQARVVTAQPPLLALIAAPSAGVRVIESGQEVYGGMLPIEGDGAIPMRVYNKLVDGRRSVAAIVGQEEAQRGKALAALETRSSPPSLPGSSQASRLPGALTALGADVREQRMSRASPPRVSRRPSGASGAGGLPAARAGGASLDERAQTAGANAARYARAPSPQRSAWPETAEFRVLRGRERAPVARHNLAANARHAHGLLAGEAPTRSWSAESSSVGSLLRSRSVVDGMTIHSPQRHVDILQLAGK